MQDSIPSSRDKSPMPIYNGAAIAAIALSGMAKSPEPRRKLGSMKMITKIERARRNKLKKISEQSKKRNRRK